MKSYTISVSSKGQIVLPVQIRKEMELDNKGRQVTIDYSSKKRTITIKKAESFQDIQKKLAHLTKGKEPLLDPRGFYNTRKPRV
jgi:bifunctional DNA-binding transcriptional regulator/antitoxin component of YhaV-PrlF toxin-antitoxin module